MREYDEVYIGCSPGNMLEAINSRLRGRTVLIIYPEGLVGGAWSGINILGEQNIESAPHFFQSKPNCEFLSKEFGFKLIEVPKAIWLVRFKSIKRIMTDRGAKTLIELLAILISIVKLKRYGFSVIKKIKKHFLELIFLIFDYQESHVYVQSGCVKMCEKFYKVALSHGVDFEEDEVKNISVNKKDVVLSLGDCSKLKSRVLKITSRSHFKKIDIENERHFPRLVKISRWQVHFWGTRSRRDWYVVRGFGEGFFALSNLSMIGHGPLRQGEDLYSLTLDFCDDSSFMEIIQKFKDNKLLPYDFKVSSYEFSEVKDYRMDDFSYEVLKNQGSVKLVGDIDFSKWLESISRRWPKNFAR